MIHSRLLLLICSDQLHPRLRVQQAQQCSLGINRTRVSSCPNGGAKMKAVSSEQPKDSEISTHPGGDTPNSFSWTIVISEQPLKRFIESIHTRSQLEERSTVSRQICPHMTCPCHHHIVSCFSLQSRGASFCTKRSICKQRQGEEVAL